MKFFGSWIVTITNHCLSTSCEARRDESVPHCRRSDEMNTGRTVDVCHPPLLKRVDKSGNRMVATRLGIFGSCATIGKKKTYVQIKQKVFEFGKIWSSIISFHVSPLLTEQTLRSWMSKYYRDFPWCQTSSLLIRSLPWTSSFASVSPCLDALNFNILSHVLNFNFL